MPSKLTPLQMARKGFGFEALLPGQRDAIRAILSGHDALAILPTGGGS